MKDANADELVLLKNMKLFSVCRCWSFVPVSKPAKDAGYSPVPLVLIAWKAGWREAAMLFHIKCKQRVDALVSPMRDA